MTLVEAPGHELEMARLNVELVDLYQFLGSASLAQGSEASSGRDASAIIAAKEQLGLAIWHINSALYATDTLARLEPLPLPHTEILPAAIEERPTLNIETETEILEVEETAVAETSFARMERLQKVKEQRIERSRQANARPPISTLEDVEPQVTAVYEHLMHGSDMPGVVRRRDARKAMQKVARIDGVKDKEVSRRFRDLNLALLEDNDSVIQNEFIRRAD